MINFSHARSVPDSIREYGRGIAGGLIFSLPLLMTMEVWWAGFVLHPWRILSYVAATFVLLLIYNRFAGLRRDASFGEVVIDSVEEMGLGLLLAAIVLLLTGRIDAAMSGSEIWGKIIVEAMTVAIGVSVGTAQLGAGGDGDEGFGSDTEDKAHFLPQVGLAFCGGVLFAANLAPTEEIAEIARETTPWHHAGMIFGPMLLAWTILHFANFLGAKRHASGSGPLFAFRAVVVTYTIALLASAYSLWCFGTFDGEPTHLKFSMILTLAVPATLGASAGRLLIQSQ